MHVIARTRPWTITREEAMLEAFSEWLYAQPDAPVMLNEIAIEHVQRYSVASALNSIQHHALVGAIHNLYLWAAKQGWVERNPFAAAPR